VPDLGIRILLLAGSTVPLPVSASVIEALREVEVQLADRERSGFQMTFTLGRTTPVEYDLLATGMLDPAARVILMVFFGAVPDVLIDGIVTDHQVTPSGRPGESRLTISGVDVSVMMDLEEKSATYANQPDNLVVMRLIAGYAQYGLIPMAAPSADIPIELMRIPSQQGTDYQHIQRLAERNGYVFYVEPTPVPGVNTAYWGPPVRAGLPQPAISLNMGAQTNVEGTLHARLDALGPASPEVTIVEPLTGIAISIPIPSLSGLPLALSPAPSLRRTVNREGARLNPAQALGRAMAEASRGADALTLTGEVDGIRYGSILRPHKLVGVRGAGLSYSGLYYVQQVTHRIRAGEYKQSFSLVREGRVATTPAVVP
jgi:hypothetical protein